MLDFDTERPIFLQLAEQLEDAILSGAFGEEEQLPSITELSVQLQINPATALKGINLLVDEGVAYKKRGLGMFVSPGAAEALRKKRRELFLGNAVKGLIREAKRLGISQDELIEMVKDGMKREGD